MSIACDARALVGPRTGVGTWTEQLVRGFADRGHHVLLAASRAIDRGPFLERREIEVLPPPRHRVPGSLWLQHTLPSRLVAAGAHVFIGALAIVPRRCPVPAIAMVHDLTPRSLPHRHTLANRFCFNAYLESSLDEAEAVVAGSRATADELVEAHPAVARKLRVIGYGVDPFFSPAEPGDDGETTRQRFSGGRPYVLHLGTLEPRKGIDSLVAAWERLQLVLPDSPDLVIAGGEGWSTAPILARIAASPHGERIHRPGYVSREDARALLRHAAVFVLASEAEGFGLPVAEAIACDTPVVVSDIPVLRETAGEAGLFVPVGDVEALTDAITQALETTTASRLRCFGRDRAAAFGWDRVVASWLDLVDEVSSVRG